MKITYKLFGALSLSLACAAQAMAADRTVFLPLQPAIDAALAAGKIDGSVKFYLAGTGPKGKVLEAGVVTNRKTNAFAKKDADACLWVAQSAVIALHEAAKKANANAVTNIVSYYRKNEYSSKTDYECHAGAVVAGVALRGDLTRLK
ncbi:MULTISPECIES: excinuclease [Achromobacter]|uniref:Excinuclease n=1 Tax=Achromobacter spanius TaxID=217203 RepID=A0ABY8GUH0_9BURK|nr:MULTISPECIES: excinuclease [Achromobacter]WAI82242.1 excinuclease [Achromobacter spanius]WEX92330.1 excinuclease [Achromobacter sp. SS2-2022]WFP08519.1 excinuclease [Achromobacter spanius]